MPRNAGLCFACVLLYPCAFVRADDDRLVVGHRDPPFAASLVGRGPEGEWQFAGADGEQTLAASDIAYWGEWTDQFEQAVCLLDHEGLLVASVVGVGEQDLLIESRLWHRTTVPRRLVRGLVLHPPLDALERDRLYRRIYDDAQAQDRLWLANGDELTGRLAATPPGYGTDLFGLGALHFQLPGAADPMVIETENVVAVALAAAAPRRPPGESTGAFVAFRDGTCLRVANVEPGDGQVALLLDDGLRLTTDANRFFDEITLLQPLHRDVVYLSALEPASYRHVPFLDVRWPLARDQSVLGGMLRANGHAYRRGLAMHSTSRVVYDLGGRYGSFAAALALDERAGEQGSVIYRVFLEMPTSGQATAWRVAFESSIVRGGSPPILVNLDVQRAQRIALVVDFADHGDTLDHANWLNARLLRQAR